MSALDLAHRHEFSCVVSVKDYPDLQRNCPKNQARDFDIENIAGIPFYFDLYPNGVSDADEGFASLFLCAQTQVSIMLSATFDLVDNEERCAYDPVELEHVEFLGGQDSGHGFANFYKKTQIDKHLSSGGTLRIRITLKFVEKARLSIPFPPSLAFERTSVGLPGDVVQLSDDLNTMLSEGDGDVTFVASDGEVLAHKNILKARSPVFKAMLDSKMKESISSRIQCEDMDVLTVRRLLHFIYTAELPAEMIDDEEGRERWLHLAAAADKYNIPGLVAACVHYIKLWLDCGNVLDYLADSHRLGLRSLKCACLEYATKDNQTIALVQDSPSFETLSADLVREVFVLHTGGSKRKRADAHEFPDGSDWERLTLVQMQRACDERGLPTLGDKGELLARLGSSGKYSGGDEV